MRLNQSRRQRIGYTYPPQVNNDITKKVHRRNMYNVMINEEKQNSGIIGGACNACYDEQNGEGLFDIARSIYNKGKKLFGKTSDLYGSEIGKTVQNLLPSSDENARPGYPGEKHAILKLPNGKFGVANYMGQPWAQVQQSMVGLVV